MDESFVLAYPDLERNHFWWRTRREFLSRLIAAEDSDGQSRILEVGCGSGVFALELANRYRMVVGVDSEFADRENAHPNLSFRNGDYLQLFAELGLFDIVLALDAVEHFSDESKVVSALFENTRSGGKVIITVPAYRWLWSRHDDLNHHYRRYSKSNLAATLTREGFAVDRIGYLFFGLIPPKALVAASDRILGSSPKPTTAALGAMNRVAAAYFSLESRLAARLRGFLPAGTSVVAVATKPVGESVNVDSKTDRGKRS